LPRLPASAVIAALQRLGFQVVRQKGSHVVPLHRRDLAVGTLGSVLRQAGVDAETFIDVL
jgi:predicted RNA binding protein YcfA (HicA-like mRNA interferase family)